MAKYRYRYPMCDYPLYVGTRIQMESFMNNRGPRFRETHVVKKIPWIRVGKNRYGIYRK